LSTVPKPGTSTGSNKALLFFVALLLLFGGGMLLFFGYKHFQRSNSPGAVTKRARRPEKVLPKPEEVDGLVHDFLLTDRSGGQWSSEQMVGKVWVASFFFASCPNSCQQQNQTIQALHRDFAAKGVTFLSITCDPSRDTPERLREYAMKFTTDVDHWKFLSGDLLYTRRIGVERFRVAVAEQTHMDRLLVVDKWGTTRGSFHWKDGKQLEEMKTLLPQLLSEKEQPKEPAKEQPKEPVKKQTKDPVKKQAETQRQEQTKAKKGAK